MRDRCSFALAPDGQQLAVGDGPELLVYRGDGQPIYKHFCDGILLHIAYIGDTLATVDSEGRVVFYRAADGHKREETQLEGVPVAAFATGDALGVITSQGVALVETNGQVVVYPVSDVACGSFGPDRSSMGLGTRGGWFVAMDGMSGAAWGQLDLQEPIADVAWNHQGYWVVATPRGLVRIDGGANAILGQIALDAPPRQIAVSASGAICAVLQEEGRVTIVELNTYSPVGHVHFRREVHGIAFGREALLGFGLDDGDASLVDLITRSSVRTEPHPGRGRNNWNMDLSFDDAKVRAAITLMLSGGAAPELQVPADELQGGRRGWLGMGCMLMNVLFFACGGCLGISFLLHYMRYL